MLLPTTNPAGARGTASPGVQDGLSTGLLTCSFRRDFELCQLLCETVDRFVPQSIEHLLIVPNSDLAMFSTLRSSRRRVESVRAFEPGWFWHLPQPSERWRKALHLPRQEIIITPYTQPVRGWIAQQIRKIAASVDVGWDAIVHVDCDMGFIRPLQLETLVQNGKVRFYRDPSSFERDPHWRWHLATCKLLGLPPSRFLGADYVCHLPVWRRSIVQRLVQRITDVSGQDWRIALARAPHLSEYLLYGAYADHLAQDANEVLFATSAELCTTCWEDEALTPEFEKRCMDTVQPHHLSLGLQSTMSLSIDDRRHLTEAAIARAAQQDKSKSAAPLRIAEAHQAM